MSPPRQSTNQTRDRMVEAAATLLQRRGYAATNWRDLVDEAGAPLGSAHYHFPGGKEELAVAAVNLGARRVADTLEQSLACSGGVPEGVRLWFEASATATRSSQFATGSPVATMALEATQELPDLAGACAEAFDAWQAILAQALNTAGLDKARALELAAITVALLEGSLLLARTSRTTAPVTLAAKHAENVLAEDLARTAG